MILLIDNYDSFTYNLYQIVGQLYSDVKVVRNDEITLDDIERLKPRLSFSPPAPAHPKTAGVTIDAVKRFPGASRFWACAWGTRPSGKPSAAKQSQRKR